MDHQYKTLEVQCVLDKSRLQDLLIESLGLKYDTLAVRNVDLTFLDNKLVLSYTADYEMIRRERSL
jgi:hypothetical protein